jgi:hypothetical protein
VLCFIAAVFEAIVGAAMARLVVLVISGMLLASCASGGAIGDIIPHWAGGLPKNAPPRPGTPEYEAYIQQLQSEAARDKSKDVKESAAAPAER